MPWLLLHPDDVVHVGTLDIDLALDPVVLDDTEYAELIDALRAHGYAQRAENRPFQLVREVPAKDDGPAIDVYVDFLMPRNAVVPKRERPLIENFAVQRADAADLAVDFQTMVETEESMPGSAGRNRVQIAVAFAGDEGPRTRRSLCAYWSRRRRGRSYGLGRGRSLAERQNDAFDDDLVDRAVLLRITGPHLFAQRLSFFTMTVGIRRHGSRVQTHYL